MIVESVSKDEREAGIKGNILGNAKTYTDSYKPGPEVKPTETTDIETPF